MNTSDSPALKLITGPRPLIIGHRGYCAVAPENTLPSFQRALDTGADLIELDYHTSRDGVPFAIHDDTLDRTTDARTRWRQNRIRVSDKTAAEIQQLDAGGWFGPAFGKARVPLLTEALDCITRGGSVPLIEHKSGDAAACAMLLREHGWINRVVVISFDWSYLRAFHRLEPAQALGALGRPTHLADGTTPRRRSKPLSGPWLDDLAATGARVVVWNRQVSSAALELAHQRGLKVWIYTVNHPRAARLLFAAGVDGIITNEVTRMMETFPRRAA